MALYYVAGFDTTRIGAMTVVIGGTVGAATATVTPGTYAHSTFANATSAEVSVYTDFATALAAALTAARPAATWTVAWSSTTYLYTVSCTVAFTLAFNAAAAAPLARVLGFNTAITSNQASHVGGFRPYYLMVPQIAGRSEYTDVYEPEEIAEEAVADGGTAYSISKDTSELWCDWSQNMETKAATFTRAAADAGVTVLWTWQDFWKHCRGEQVFVVFDDNYGLPYRLRADGASFKPNRVASDYDGLWNLEFATRDLGRFTL